MEVKFLGFRVNIEGISIDPDKVKVVTDWLKLESVKDMQSFLRFANFYQRFIQGYSKVTVPLTDLM